MNTSLVFAELIIIGLEGGIWLLLLFTGAYGAKALSDILSLFRDWQILVTAVLLVLIYVFGVIIDRMADWAFRSREHKLDDEIVGNMPVTISVMRYSLGTQNDFLNQQLEYTRTRIRIVRASTINFLLIAVGLSFFFLNQLPASAMRLQYVAITLLAGGALSYGSYRTWRSLKRAHLTLAKEMYDHQSGLSGKKKTSGRQK